MKKYTQKQINKILEASDKAREMGIEVKLNLRGADLRGADLQGADLRGVDLRVANLQVANLQEADLRGANLQRADLWESNLRGADLRGADLRGADLDFASLNLACTSLNFKADDRLFDQLAYHLANIMLTSGRHVPESIIEMANNSHLICEHELPELENKERTE